MIKQSTCTSLHLLSMIAGHFNSFHQILNPCCTATFSARGDVTGVGCPALLPGPCRGEGRSWSCTVSAGSLWWLPGCRSPHRALSRCKVSVWRRSFCEGGCSWSVDTSEGRQAKRDFSVCVLTKIHHIRTRWRAGLSSILLLSLIPAEAAPSQARVHGHAAHIPAHGPQHVQGAA